MDRDDNLSEVHMLVAESSPPTTALAPLLLDCLQTHLRVRNLAYAQPPTAIADGWEAHVYRFQLRDQADLPRAFARPLIVRGYCSRNGRPRAWHEFEIQSYLVDLDYPVARPLLIDDRDDLFGGPFMIMEQAPGRTLLDVMLHNLFSILWLPAEMARAHVRLHQLPPPRGAQPRAPFLERSLAELAGRLQDHGLYGMEAGLDWLEQHQPAQPAEECILHLDFHPINLIFEDSRCRAVLDWSESDVGDRHADLGATVMLVETAPVELRRLYQKIATAVGKHMLKHWYMQEYRKHLTVDDNKLTYYTAWAAFRRLSWWGCWLRSGPHVTGGKPSSIAHLRPERIGALCQSFEKRTGVAITL